MSGKVGRAILVLRSLGRKMRRVWANEEEEQKEDIWLWLGLVGLVLLFRGFGSAAEGALVWGIDAMEGWD